ncbi:hypothetical protein G4B88_011072 [Cannabis sativa]|uniref:RNase H type-1 domain-containing protein n=1 Tax=Cannabis sativa TaxID=3483 RepID=A0A7J6FAN6_CANSA|nr:hypothetical protein G4B88_011072 [Cannabis sativa]
MHERKRKRSREVRNERGRYFASPGHHVFHSRKVCFEKNFARDYNHVTVNKNLNDLIAMDFTGDDAKESNDPISEHATICDGDTSDLELDNFEELLIKPILEVSHHQSYNSQSSIPCIIQEDTPALYVDAALDQDNCVTGLGFVFKIGPHRVVASAKIHKPGSFTPIFAEGQALLEGISWCLSSQLRPEFIFTDCRNLVSKVNGHWKDQSALSSLVSKIRYSSNFPDVSLKYLPRQFNANAHSLAKEAIRLREEDDEELF